MSGYVLLTGARNNAGDYLIGHRARSLLRRYRPDRDLVDFDAWKPLTDEQLDVINNSKALLLTGGPALQPRLWPKVYPLVGGLERIQVPIIAFGLGWKSANGDVQAIRDYRFTDQSMQLLKRMAQSNYQSSVRDYHTLEVMNRYGFDNYTMTGCPALYEPDSFEVPVQVEPAPKRIVFSLGVEAAKSPRLLLQTRQLLDGICAEYGVSNLTVAFHHSLDERYAEAYGSKSKLTDMQTEMVAWLEGRGIAFTDVSGGLDAMLELYSSADLHIGYRIHAHILCLSLSRPSVIISEDGRGIALREVTGGLNFNAFQSVATGVLSKVARKLGVVSDPYTVDPDLPKVVLSHLRNELQQPARLQVTRHSVNQHFTRMHNFLKALP